MPRSNWRASTRCWRFAARCADAVVVATLLGGTAARAEEPAVHIIGSRLPVAETGVAQEASIVARPEIAWRPGLPDALRELPELHVDQPGAPAGFSSVYLRGADPNHAVFLIDGIKVNDLTNVRGGGFDLSSIDPAMIERIEVLPGASSGIYGADAMSGVINVVTRRARGAGASIGAGAGGLGYRRLSAAVDAGRTRGGLSALEDGGERELGFKRVRSAALRFPAASLLVWQHESRAFPEDSGGARFAVLREMERRDSDNVLVSAGAAWDRWRIRGGVLSQEAEVASPGVAPGLRDPFGLPRSLASSRFTRWQGTLTAEFAGALAGAEIQAEHGDMQSTLSFGTFDVPAAFSLQRRTRSVFAEARTELLPRLSGQGGLRVDDVEGYAPRASVKTGLRYLFAAGHRAALNLGTGFKPPSFFALGHPLVGNPQLRPEESASAEASISSSDDASTRHRIALFRSRYRDLIDFDPGPPPRLVNRNNVHIDGIEYALSKRLDRRLTASAGFSSLSIELPEGASPLRSRPRHKASAGLGARLAEGATLKLAATRVGRVFDSSIPTGGRYLDAYVVVDGAFTYARKAAQLTFAIDNLFDRDYEQFIGFPAIGRRLRVQLSLGGA